MEEENIRNNPEKTKNKNGRYSEGKKIESDFEKVVTFKRRSFSKKESDTNIHSDIRTVNVEK
jgi:hypothetical protein